MGPTTDELFWQRIVGMLTEPASNEIDFSTGQAVRVSQDRPAESSR
jgi:hypothetical protein